MRNTPNELTSSASRLPQLTRSMTKLTNLAVPCKRSTVKWITLCYCLINLAHSRAVLVHKSQVSSLLSIKLSIGNSTLETWEESSQCEAWTGVTCDRHGFVISIVLTTTQTILAPDKIVQATLPSAATFANFPQNFSGLSSLQHLVITGTSMSGFIPESIKSLTNLRTLNLSMNQLTGPILDLRTLTSIEILDLQLNAVTATAPSGFGVVVVEALNGSVPASFSELTSLTTLCLNGNLLSGVFPSLSKLERLTYLSVGQNSLKGNVSDILGYHPNIAFLDMSYNHFSGTIPEIIGSYSNLVEIDLSENAIQGSIPSSIGNLSKLQLLNFETNRLTSAPASIGSLKSLTHLNLRNNLLSGEIPFNLQQLTNIQVIDLDLNDLSGPIGSLSTLKELNYLDLSQTSLTGSFSDVFHNEKLQALILDDALLNETMPDDFTRLRNLQTLSLKNTFLYNEINPNFGNLSMLSQLMLSENYLIGSIPSSFQNITSLETIQLDNNQLSGSVPDCISNLVNLSDLTLSVNQFSGSIPMFASSQATLSTLSLGSNNFSGKIPEELGSIWGLYVLDLSFNQLEGSIPKSLSQLPSLTDLDLSYNRLNGSLPVELEQLSALTLLNFSHNSFSGSLPANVFGSMQTLSFLGLSHNSFSGSIPSNISSSAAMDFSNNHFSGALPPFAESQRPSSLSLQYNSLNRLPNMNNISSLNKNLDLNGNPLCSSSQMLRHSIFCALKTNIVRYEAPSLCPNLLCMAGNIPNVYRFFVDTECACSASSMFIVGMSSKDAGNFNSLVAKRIANFFAGQIGVSPLQVLVSSAESQPSGTISITIHLFSQTTSLPSASLVTQVSSLFAPFGNSKTVSIPSIGLLWLIGSYSNQYLDPLAPLSDNSTTRGGDLQSSSGKVAHILEAVLVSFLALVLVAIFLAIVAKRNAANKNVTSKMDEDQEKSKMGVDHEKSGEKGEDGWSLSSSWMSSSSTSSSPPYLPEHEELAAEKGEGWPESKETGLG